MVKPQDDNQLESLSLKQFVKSVSARTAAPGGGSVSAAVAALVKKTNKQIKQKKNQLFNWKENPRTHTLLPHNFFKPFTFVCAAGGSVGCDGGSDDLWKEAV